METTDSPYAESTDQIGLQKDYFDHVIRLSVIDILILQTVIEIDRPIPKQFLLDYINSNCASRLTKLIAKSTLYHRLSDLHSKGFVEITGSGKGQKVQSTPLSLRVLREVNTITMSGLQTIDIQYQNALITNILINKLGLPEDVKFESILYVNPDDITKFHAQKDIVSLANNFYILSNDETFDRYKKILQLDKTANLTPMLQTRFEA
ncbi:MAG: hypothetical protein ACXAD7_25115, partial [Candidatus Kariarchaeaceae archaeon]